VLSNRKNAAPPCLPRCSGDEPVLDSFCSFFEGKQLDKGTEVALLRHADGTLDALLRPPGTPTPYSSVSIDSAHA
jgi:hypothetical protein